MDDRCDVRMQPTTLDLKSARLLCAGPKWTPLPPLTLAKLITEIIIEHDSTHSPCNQRGGLLLTRRSLPGCFYLCWQQMRLIKSIYISMCVRLKEGQPAAVGPGRDE